MDVGDQETKVVTSHMGSNTGRVSQGFRPPAETKGPYYSPGLREALTEPIKYVQEGSFQFPGRARRTL